MLFLCPIYQTHLHIHDVASGCFVFVCHNLISERKRCSTDAPFAIRFVFSVLILYHLWYVCIWRTFHRRSIINSIFPIICLYKSSWRNSERKRSILELTILIAKLCSFQRFQSQTNQLINSVNFHITDAARFCLNMIENQIASIISFQHNFISLISNFEAIPANFYQFQFVACSRSVDKEKTITVMRYEFIRRRNQIRIALIICLFDLSIRKIAILIHLKGNVLTSKNLDFSCINLSAFDKRSIDAGWHNAGIPLPISIFIFLIGCKNTTTTNSNYALIAGSPNTVIFCNCEVAIVERIFQIDHIQCFLNIIGFDCAI